jgi:hypothetical protein
LLSTMSEVGRVYDWPFRLSLVPVNTGAVPIQEADIFPIISTVTDHLATRREIDRGRDKTPGETRENMDLRKLLLAHGVITLAAAIVLVVAPGVIPATVGIELQRDAYLLSWLLAGMELGLAVLSFQGRRLKDPQALRVVVTSCIVVHASTAALEIYGVTRGVDRMIWSNIIARIVIVVLFLYYGGLLPGWRSDRV